MKLCVIFTKICLKLYFLIYKKKWNKTMITLGKKKQKFFNTKLFDTSEKMINPPKIIFCKVPFILISSPHPFPPKKNKTKRNSKFKIQSHEIFKPINNHSIIARIAFKSSFTLFCSKKSWVYNFNFLIAYTTIS